MAYSPKDKYISLTDVMNYASPVNNSANGVVLIGGRNNCSTSQLAPTSSVVTPLQMGALYNFPSFTTALQAMNYCKLLGLNVVLGQQKSISFTSPITSAGNHKLVLSTSIILPSTALYGLTISQYKTVGSAPESVGNILSVVNANGTTTINYSLALNSSADFNTTDNNFTVTAVQNGDTTPDVSSDSIVQMIYAFFKGLEADFTLCRNYTLPDVKVLLLDDKASYSNSLPASLANGGNFNLYSGGTIALTVPPAITSTVTLNPTTGYYDITLSGYVAGFGSMPDVAYGNSIMTLTCTSTATPPVTTTVTGVYKGKMAHLAGNAIGFSLAVTSTTLPTLNITACSLAIDQTITVLSLINPQQFVAGCSNIMVVCPYELSTSADIASSVGGTQLFTWLASVNTSTSVNAGWGKLVVALGNKSISKQSASTLPILDGYSFPSNCVFLVHEPSVASPLGIKQLTCAMVAGAVAPASVRMLPYYESTNILSPGVVIGDVIGSSYYLGDSYESICLNQGWNPQLANNQNQCYVYDQIIATTIDPTTGFVATSNIDLRSTFSIGYLHIGILAIFAKGSAYNTFATDYQANVFRNALISYLKTLDANTSGSGILQNVAQLAPQITITVSTTNVSRYIVYIPATLVKAYRGADITLFIS